MNIGNIHIHCLTGVCYQCIKCNFVILSGTVPTHFKHAVNGTSDSALDLSCTESWISIFRDCTMPFNRKCDQNMFGFCRLPLFSLSLSLMCLFSQRSDWRLLNPSFHMILYLKPGPCVRFGGSGFLKVGLCTFA